MPTILFFFSPLSPVLGPQLPDNGFTGLQVLALGLGGGYNGCQLPYGGALKCGLEEAKRRNF